MDWQQLTPYQRNVLVHRKVMQQSLICPQKNVPVKRHSFYLIFGFRTTDYWCWKCKLCGATGDQSVESHVVSPQAIPDYTNDIKTTWQVIEQMSESAAFADWWNRTALWKYSKSAASEAICIAALRASGVIIEIEQEEITHVC